MYTEFVVMMYIPQITTQKVNTMYFMKVIMLHVGVVVVGHNTVKVANLASRHKYSRSLHVCVYDDQGSLFFDDRLIYTGQVATISFH